MKIKVNIPVYNFEVWVTDWKHAKKADKGVTEDCVGGLVYWYQGQLCVWVSTAKPKFLPNLICHESVHVALEILGLVGVPADKDNQEALAYLTAYIRDKIAETLRANLKPVQKRKKK